MPLSRHFSSAACSDYEVNSLAKDNDLIVEAEEDAEEVAEGAIEACGGTLQCRLHEQGGLQFTLRLKPANK